MDNGDGISLQATAHPKAPWYKSLWLWLFHRDIRESSLELVTVETMKRDALEGRLDQERKLANIFNSLRLHDQDETVPMDIPPGTYQHLNLPLTYDINKPNLGRGFTVSNIQYCQSCKAKTWHNDDVCEWADIAGHKDQK